MLDCECGGRFVRVRRRLWQRPFYKAVYRCRDCGNLSAKKRPRAERHPYSACPRCGTTVLKVRHKRDHIDSMKRGPMNWIRRVFGAELHHCEFCRLQFYDFRKVAARDAEKNRQAFARSVNA